MGKDATGDSARVSVVMLTHDRRERALHGLRALAALPERPPIVVVDNASSDGTPEAVRRELRGIRVIELEENIGAAGRNIGVEHVDTPYVAFSDDDSWWAPGALTRAAEAFDRHARLGAIHGRILVGDEEREDPICDELRASPLPGEPSLPGMPLLGFLACAVIFRREAFRAVGGFERSVMIGGEEEWLACDLAGAGWEIRYVDDVIAYHDPPRRVGAAADARRRAGLRNTLWFNWLRRPAGSALRRTLHLAGTVPRDRVSALAFADAARGLVNGSPRRRLVAPHVERMLQLLDRPQMQSTNRKYVS
jgi:GT2 family glycosyltransferase